MKIIGNKEHLQKMLTIFHEMNYNKHAKYFLLVQGTYGIGKSFFVKHFLKQVNKMMEEGQCPRFKYGEFANIFISVFSVIKGTLKMNGMRSILKQVFKAICNRKGIAPTEESLR